MSRTSKQNADVALRCLSLDLEVGVQDKRIHAFAGVRSDTSESLVFSEASMTWKLTEALSKYLK